MNPPDSTGSKAKQEPSREGVFSTFRRYPLITWMMIFALAVILF